MSEGMKEFTYLQVDHICYQIGEWYLNWKDRISPGNQHALGFAKEELKSMICGDKDIFDLEDERLQLQPSEEINITGTMRALLCRQEAICTYLAIKDPEFLDTFTKIQFDIILRDSK